MSRKHLPLLIFTGGCVAMAALMWWAVTPRVHPIREVETWDDMPVRVGALKEWEVVPPITMRHVREYRFDSLSLQGHSSVEALQAFAERVGSEAYQSTPRQLPSELHHTAHRLELSPEAIAEYQTASTWILETWIKGDIFILIRLNPSTSRFLAWVFVPRGADPPVAALTQRE